MRRATFFVLAALTLTTAAVLTQLGDLRVARAARAPVAMAGEGVRLEVRASHAAVSSAGGEVYAELRVKADDVRQSERGQVSVALVLDTSGSMKGDKLDQAKAAARRLVELLEPADELAVVRFSTWVTSTPLLRMDAAGRAEALAFIASLSADGGTNISEGLSQGERVLASATGTRRLVLVSDGQPTAGVVEPSQLAGLAGAVHLRSVAVTALGVGTDYDSRLMMELADRGGGFYGYLQDSSRLEAVLEKELAQAGRGFARGVTVTLSPGPSFTVTEVPGRALNRVGTSVEVPLPDLGPSDEARIYVRLAGRGTDAAQADLVTASLQWTRVGAEAGPLTQVALQLPVVSGERAVEASRQEEVFAACVRALGANQLMTAAAAYERGDRALAFSMLDNVRSLYGMSADALAGDTADLAVTSRAWKGETDSSKQKHLVKDFERKKLGSFGKSNDYY